MIKISSKQTFFLKRVFPVIWFGGLACFLAVGISNRGTREDPMFFLMPFVMAAFGFFIMKNLVWDLMDEVYDCGDSLLVRNRGVELRVPLSNIINVSFASTSNPPRITLKLAKPGNFGQEIVFSPPATFALNPFAKNTVAEDLIFRVDKARATRVF